MTNRLNSIAWTEGMFLRPQHFQHNNLYFEEKLHYHLSAIDPFHWGIREFKIDEEALSDYRIVIQRLDAVLPGGTLIRCMDTEPGNAVVQTRGFDREARKVDIFVGVRRWSASDANAMVEQESAADTRFVLRTHSAPDLQRGENHAELTLEHPNVRVFLSGEEEMLELYESIRIGQIEATGELARPFRLNLESGPPLLRVEAWPSLYNDIAELVSQMAARIPRVAGRTQTMEGRGLREYWSRYTLSRLTPVLRHRLATGFTRPFDLYMVLLEAAAALAAFQTSEAVTLPNYDHDDPVSCFKQVIREIDTRLEDAIPTRFTKLDLKWQASDRLYVTTELNTTLVDPRNLIYLAVKASLEPKELATWVSKDAKAGSAKGVKALVMASLKGLAIEHLPAAPTEIHGGHGFQYFQVSPTGAQWNKVREEFSFALSLGKLEDAEANLFIVTPEG